MKIPVPMPIISISGVRGVVNSDLDSSLAESIGLGFGTFLKSGKVALACDTRTTSQSLKAALGAGLVRAGCIVYDLGLSSTPSVFKEVALRNLSGGAIVTASHNPPEWNGIKFVVGGGRGAFEDELESIMSTAPKEDVKLGRMFNRKARYVEILQERAGFNSASGVKVALDLAGGVGSYFVGSIMSYQGCKIHSIHDSPGIFPRIIDPTVDPLLALSNSVLSEECDAGFAYDCDADRLVIVDQSGNKMWGDATLLICLKYFLENSRNRRVAVSVDTSLAANDLVREYNGKIIYSKVGESNVVRKIIENNCGAGGEGSSGGYIEPAFVMCRDGVHASTMITRMIKSEGSLKAITSSFKRYSQDRAKLEIDTKLAPKILEALSTTEGDVDLTDGVKIRMSDKSWVLIRGSNTENVIRVSAESESPSRSSELVGQFSKKIIEIAREIER
jgi:phosphomannomutase